jgi:hypothetical protein
MIWAACAAGALQAESSGKNTTTVVISDGHFAGSYTVDNEGCLYIKDRDIFGVTLVQKAEPHSPRVCGTQWCIARRVSAERDGI